MRTFLRGKITLLFITCAVLLAIPAIALADDIANNLDASIDADVETTSVNTGSTKTVGYLVQPRNGDDQNGCNIQGGEALTVNVASSNTAVATVSPSSLTFSSCGATPSVTVTGVSPGTANITLTQASNNTGGTFNFNTATFSVTVSNPTPPADTTAPTIDYTLNPGTPDGANGWYKSDVTLTWTVTDSESAVTKTGCNNQNITSDQQATTYSCSATSAGGSAGPVSVSIKRDATAPTNVAGELDRAADSNGWYNHAVNATFTGDDATSSIASCSSDGAYSGPDGTGKTVTGSCTDNAGNSASGSSPTFNYDATAPDATAAADRSADHNGWYNAPFTVNFSGTDETSGNVSCDPAEVNYNGPDTSGDSISSSCTDDAGNSDSATFDFKYDNTDPAISGTRSPGANSFGWNNGPVTVSYSCSDEMSDVASCEPDETLSSEGASQSSTGNATDNAGNTASATVNNINIDLTNPLVSLNGGPANDSSHYFGFVPSAPTCSASDALSGLNGTCSVSGYGTGVGSHTVKATANDKAGNSNEASNSYTVLGWDFRGFYQPVDMGTTVNTVKGGSTVPFKFELFAGSNELTETSRVVTPLKATKVNCDTGATEDTIELLATGGTSLRYDTTGGQYIYNWQTPKQAGACYDVTISAQDTSSKTAHFKLK
jgi:hypothetical protein